MKFLWQTKYVDGIMRVYVDTRKVSTPRRGDDTAIYRIFVFEKVKNDREKIKNLFGL